MKDRVIQIPKIEKRITLKEKVLELLKSKDYTANEITTKLNITDRTVRDAIMRLKREYDINETRCRCGHTPIYKVKHD